VFSYIDGLRPSARGELEITQVLNHDIAHGGLFTRIYECQWTDAGTVGSLLHAAQLAASEAESGRLKAPPERPTS